MPTTSDGIYYETSGEGGLDGTSVVTFLADLGFGPWQWAWQAPTLAGPYRTVVPTTRGCGRSATPPTPWTPDDLLADLRGVLRAADVRRTHLVAAGLAGPLALVAARRLDRVDRLVLLAPPRDPGDVTNEFTPPDDRAAVRESFARLCSDEFRRDHPNAVDRITDWRTTEDADHTAWSATRDALVAADPEPLYEVTTETLVVHGTADRVVPAEAGRTLADDLPHGEFYAVPDAGHLVGCEAPRPVGDRLLAFLGEPDPE